MPETLFRRPQCSDWCSSPPGHDWDSEVTFGGRSVPARIHGRRVGEVELAAGPVVTGLIVVEELRIGHVSSNCAPHIELLSEEPLSGICDRDRALLADFEGLCRSELARFRGILGALAVHACRFEPIDPADSLDCSPRLPGLDLDHALARDLEWAK